MSVFVGVVGLVTIVGLSDLIFLVPKNSGVGNNQVTIMEKVSFFTQDQKKISADFFNVQSPASWFLALPMMPATKESYLDLGQKLSSLGYAGLAIDLRGHGESDGGPNGYKSFSDKQHQDSYLDVVAAIDYLKSQGASENKIVLVGASIGANLALEYAANNQNISKVVLMSPGTDYQGIKSTEFAPKLKIGQSVLIFSSKNDDDNTTQIEQILSLIPSGVDEQKVIYDNAGHGTDMLSQPDAYDKIINFIEK